MHPAIQPALCAYVYTFVLTQLVSLCVCVCVCVRVACAVRDSPDEDELLVEQIEQLTPPDISKESECAFLKAVDSL